MEIILPSRSLKLLPILGVPSLPSRDVPLPFTPGLLPASSAVRRGDSGPAGRRSPCALVDTMAAELADESDVCDCCALSLPGPFGSRLANSRGSPRNVAPMSCPLLPALPCALNGRKAGSASSSSAKDPVSSWCCWKRGGRRMMRDWAGLEEDDEAAELDSAGPGDKGSSSVEGSGSVGVVEIGNDDNRRLCDVCRRGGLANLNEAPPAVCTVVLADDARDTCGRPMVVLFGVPGIFWSVFGIGESFRTERDDGARPPPEPVLLIASAAAVDSDPGTGDGAEEPLAAAVAFRICARTWEVCRSVRYVTCCSRNSTVT